MTQTPTVQSFMTWFDILYYGGFLIVVMAGLSIWALQSLNVRWAYHVGFPIDTFAQPKTAMLPIREDDG